MNPAPDNSDAARARLEALAMPRWALGRLMDLAVDLAGITGDPLPHCERKVVAVCAGDHGVALEGVTNYPQSVTLAMMRAVADGAAGVNAVAAVARTDVALADFGVASPPAAVLAPGSFRDFSCGRGTASILRGPAMTRAQALGCVANGVRFADELAAAGYGAVGLGEVGIGNTTAAAAIVAAVTGAAPAEVTGRGTGLSDAQFAHKVEVVAGALAANGADPADPFDLLARLGGFEIGGMAGLCLGAAARRVPVVVDGFITAAAAIVADLIAPAARESMVASHLSTEPGHRIALARLGLRPYLDLSLRLGEGSGAALMMNLVSSACAIPARVRTLRDALA